MEKEVEEDCERQRDKLNYKTDNWKGRERQKERKKKKRLKEREKERQKEREKESEVEEDCERQWDKLKYKTDKLKGRERQKERKKKKDWGKERKKDRRKERNKDIVHKQIKRAKMCRCCLLAHTWFTINRTFLFLLIKYWFAKLYCTIMILHRLKYFPHSLWKTYPRLLLDFIVTLPFPRQITA